MMSSAIDTSEEFQKKQLDGKNKRSAANLPGQWLPAFVRDIPSEFCS